MTLSIIIVNWNTCDLLRKCLKSIFEYTKELDFEVFVVDNASSDGSVEMIRNEFSEVHLIVNEKNLGFAKANNLGLEKSRGEFVLFMNPDMEIRESVFKKMLDFMRNNPDVAVSTCKLLYPDGSIQPNIKRHPTFLSQVLILLKLHHFLPFLLPIKKYLAKDFDYSKQSEVEQIMGAFVFARRDFMEKVGGHAERAQSHAKRGRHAERAQSHAKRGWDEDYFIWWEDVELCKRADELGEKIVYFPAAQVIHHEGKSFEQIRSTKKQKQFIKSMLTYFKKHHSFLERLLLLLLAPISLFLAFLIQICRIKPRSQSRI